MLRLIIRGFAQIYDLLTSCSSSSFKLCSTDHVGSGNLGLAYRYCAYVVCKLKVKLLPNQIFQLIPFRMGKNNSSFKMESENYQDKCVLAKLEILTTIVNKLTRLHNIYADVLNDKLSTIKCYLFAAHITLTV